MTTDDITDKTEAVAADGDLTIVGTKATPPTNQVPVADTSKDLTSVANKSVNGFARLGDYLVYTSLQGGRNIYVSDGSGAFTEKANQLTTGNTHGFGLVFDPDDNTVWSLDSVDNKAYGYTWNNSTQTLTRKSGADFNFASANSNCREGIFIDSVMYVADGSGTTLYAYDIDSSTRSGTYNASKNKTPSDITSLSSISRADNIVFLLAGGGTTNVRAFNLDFTRNSTYDFSGAYDGGGFATLGSYLYEGSANSAHTTVKAYRVLTGEGAALVKKSVQQEAFIIPELLATYNSLPDESTSWNDLPGTFTEDDTLRICGVAQVGSGAQALRTMDVCVRVGDIRSNTSDSTTTNRLWLVWADQAGARIQLRWKLNSSTELQICEAGPVQTTDMSVRVYRVPYY